MKKILTFALVAMMVLVVITSCGTKYKAGTITDGVYENPVAGIRFTIPSSMNVVAPSELGMTSDNQLTIEFAASAVTGENVALMVENLPGSNISMDTYVENFSESLEETAGSEMTISNFDRQTVSYGGIEFEKVSFTATVSTVYGSVEMQQIYLLKQVDNRMMAFTFTLLDNSNFNEYVSGFEAIN